MHQRQSHSIPILWNCASHNFSSAFIHLMYDNQVKLKWNRPKSRRNHIDHFWQFILLGKQCVCFISCDALKVQNFIHIVIRRNQFNANVIYAFSYFMYIFKIMFIIFMRRTIHRNSIRYSVRDNQKFIVTKRMIFFPTKIIPNSMLNMCKHFAHLIAAI